MNYACVFSNVFLLSIHVDAFVSEERVLFGMEFIFFRQLVYDTLAKISFANIFQKVLQFSFFNSRKLCNSFQEDDSSVFKRYLWLLHNFILSLFNIFQEILLQTYPKKLLQNHPSKTNADVELNCFLTVPPFYYIEVDTTHGILTLRNPNCNQHPQLFNLF